MDEISLLDYIHILRRRKWIVIAFAATALLLAGIALVFMPRTYEGETTLIFPEQPSVGVSSQFAQIAGIAMPGGLPSLSGEGIYTSVLKSRTLSESVCRRLGLEKYGLDSEDLQDSMTIEKPDDGGLVLSCQVPTSWLKGSVAPDQLRERTARLAADIANTCIGELRVYDRSNALFLGRKNRVYIEDQLARTKSDLSDAEERLRKFQEAHPTLIPPQQGDAYAAKSLDLATSRTEADVALQETEGQIAQARATWEARAPQGVSPEAIIDSPTISELRTSLASIEVQRAALLEDFTEAHPDIVSLDQQIAKTREQVRAEVSGVISGSTGSASPAHQELLKELVLLEVSRDGLESRRSAIDKAMADLEKRLSGLPADEMTYSRLIRDVKTAEVVYTTLQAEHAKALVSEGRDADNFIVLDTAVPDDEPVRPRTMLTLFGAGILGLMLGVSAAILTGISSGKKRPAV